MKILIINGPNLNLLGKREKEIYGTDTYDALMKKMSKDLKEKGDVGVFFQSNHEGDIIDEIQNAKASFDGLIINPGAFTHTSIAIADAIGILGVPTVEVHVSKVGEREDFRKVSYVSEKAVKTVSGQGVNGYITALQELRKLVGEE